MPNSNKHFQEGAFPASASALIILAEFSRVFLLSDTSTRYFCCIFNLNGVMIYRFTKDAENVIIRLEDEKMPPEKEHDKQVMKHNLISPRLDHML